MAKKSSKPFWQTSLFITLLILFGFLFPIWFWMSGADMLDNYFSVVSPFAWKLFSILPFIWLASLLLMWRYATWNIPIKFLITLPYAIIIFSVVKFSLEAPEAPEAPPAPPVINQSQYFDCKPVNEQWGRCKSLENNVSFEYPVNWYYVDDGISGIGFSPSEQKLKNREGVVITFEPLGEEESTEAAKESLRDYLAKKYPGLNYTEKEVNGFYIIDWTMRGPRDRLFVSTSIIADKMVYWIRGGIGYKDVVSEEELHSVWSHMINSLKKE